MSFEQNYRLLEAIPEFPLASDRELLAREIASGRPVFVHLLAGGQSLQNEDLARRARTLRPEDGAYILEAGYLHACPYVVTQVLPQGLSLRNWVDSVAPVEKAPEEFTRFFGIPVPKASQPPAPPRPSPTAPLPDLQARQGIQAGAPPPPGPAAADAGEFTRLFQAPLEEKPAPPPASPPPVPEPPAEPTAVAPDAASADKAEAGAAPDAPPAPPLVTPAGDQPQGGEFTRLFQLPMEPAAPSARPAAAQPSGVSQPQRESSGFTHFFEGRQEAVKPPLPAPSAPVPSTPPQSLDANQVTQAASGQAQPAVPSEPGELKRAFETPAGAKGTAPQIPQVQPPPPVQRPPSEPRPVTPDRPPAAASGSEPGAAAPPSQTAPREPVPPAIAIPPVPREVAGPRPPSQPKPAPPAEPALRVAPPRAPGSPPGEFTSLFQIPDVSESPTAPVTPRPASRAPSAGDLEEFARLFRSPASAPSPSVPRASATAPPGEFTRMLDPFTVQEASAGTLAPPPAARPAPPPPSNLGEFTRMFGGVAAPGAGTSPPTPPVAPSVGSGATRIFSTPSAPPAPGPPAAQGPTEFTRMFAPPAPSAAAPPAPAAAAPAAKTARPPVKTGGQTPGKTRAAYVVVVIVLTVLFLAAVALIVFFALRT